MPFGICNAPATFQWFNMVLLGLQWSSCIVYIDDIIVVGRSFDEHLRNLKNAIPVKLGLQQAGNSVERYSSIKVARFAFLNIEQLLLTMFV